MNTNPTILECTYNLSAISPDGKAKYSSSQPSWKENGQGVQIGDPRYTSPQPGLTSAVLYVNMTKNDPANFSCSLVLSDGSGIEESTNITVFPKSKIIAP